MIPKYYNHTRGVSSNAELLILSKDSMKTGVNDEPLGAYLEDVI